MAMLAARLNEIVYDGRYDSCDRPTFEIFHDEVFVRPNHLSMAERARRAYDQLRRVHHYLGPARDLTRDPHRMFALFEWSATFAPDLFPVLVGHYNLTVEAILKLGKGREDLNDYLEDLDFGSSVGVFLLTELGYGSNVFKMETEAVYDHPNRGFVLHTPSAAAQKFMPNVATPGVPKLVIVAARLKVGEKDCGIFPFLLRLREANGIHSGARITPLPDKPFLAVDNAIISFDHVFIPYRNWLTAGIADITADGVFHSDVGDLREHYLRTIGQLQIGRVALSSGMLACARASLHIALRYAVQRLTSVPGFATVPMIAHRNVQRGLFVGLARVYACTFFANQLKRRYAQSGTDDGELALLPLLAKPLFCRTALEVMQECRERCGAQGMFSINRIADYLGLCQGVITGEGENQVLQIAAGRRLLSEERFRPPATIKLDPGDCMIDNEKFRHCLLTERELRLHGRIVKGLSAALAPSESRFDRWNNYLPDVIALADARADRVALAALEDAAGGTDDTEAAEVLRALVSIYALDRIAVHHGWYLCEELLNRHEASRLGRQIDSACAALLPYILMLTEAFAIPDDLLDVPIASADYIAALDMRSDGNRFTLPYPPTISGRHGG